jgi:hypothetical protein
MNKKGGYIHVDHKNTGAPFFRECKYEKPCVDNPSTSLYSTRLYNLTWWQHRQLQEIQEAKFMKHSLDKHYDTEVKDHWEKTTRILMMAYYTQDFLVF